MGAHNAPVRVFAEADYCYGIGSLTLRIEAIDWTCPVWYEGENWYHVDGIEISHTGAELDRRQVLIRGRRLPSPDQSR